MTGSGCVFVSIFRVESLSVGRNASNRPTPHFISRRLLSLLPCSTLPHGITNAPAPARFLDDRQVAQLMRVRQHVQLAPSLGVRGDTQTYSVSSGPLETRTRLFTHTQHANGSNPDPVPVWQMKLLLFVIHVKCASEKPSLHHTSSPDQSPFIP